MGKLFNMNTINHPDFMSFNLLCDKYTNKVDKEYLNAIVQNYLVKKKKTVTDSFLTNEYSINKWDKLKKIRLDKKESKNKKEDKDKKYHEKQVEFDKFLSTIDDLSKLEKPKKRNKIKSNVKDLPKVVVK